MQRQTWIAVSAIVGIVIVAVVGYRLQVQPGKLTTAPIKIGVILPLSGDSAIIGKTNLDGIILAAERINAGSGQKVQIVVKDDKMDPKETLSQYRQLKDVKHVRYIMTVTYGGFLALAKQAEQDGVVLIDSLDASEELAQQGQNAFAIGIYDESIGFAIADYLNQQRVTKVAVISNIRDPFILLTRNALKSHYQGMMREENYNADTNDFRAILTKLSGYDRIVLLGWEETGRIVKQAREMGLNIKFTGIDTVASENFRKNAGGKVDGLSFTFWQGSKANPRYRDLLKAYQAKFGKEPENVAFTAIGYDATGVLAQVLQSCGDDIACTRQALRTGVKSYEGATGQITITPDGITRSILERMHTYRQGQIVELK